MKKVARSSGIAGILAVLGILVCMFISKTYGPGVMSVCSQIPSLIE